MGVFAILSIITLITSHEAYSFLFSTLNLRIHACQIVRFSVTGHNSQFRSCLAVISNPLCIVLCKMNLHIYKIIDLKIFCIYTVFFRVEEHHL